MRASLVGRLREVLGDGGLIEDATRLVAYESDGLAMLAQRPELVCLPSSTEEAAQAMRLLHEEGVPVVARGAGTGLAGGSDAGRRRRGVLVGPHAAHPRGRPHRSLRTRRGRCGQRGSLPSRSAPWPVLCARPLEPDGLHDRWERGQQLRRSALLPARGHRAPRPGVGPGEPRRRGDRSLRAASRSRRTRSHRPVRGQRRHLRPGHRGHGEARPHPRGRRGRLGDLPRTSTVPAMP